MRHPDGKQESFCNFFVDVVSDGPLILWSLHKKQDVCTHWHTSCFFYNGRSCFFCGAGKRWQIEKGRNYIWNSKRVKYEVQGSITRVHGQPQESERIQRETDRRAGRSIVVVKRTLPSRPSSWEAPVRPLAPAAHRRHVSGIKSGNLDFGGSIAKMAQVSLTIKEAFKPVIAAVCAAPPPAPAP